MSTTQTEQIRAWLQGARDWQTGLYLYGKYGKNQALKSIFAASGETAYNRSKMIAELEALAPGRHPAGGTAARRPGRKQAPTAKAATFTEETKKLFQRRSHLHAQLLRVPGLEERRALAFEILDLSEQLDKLLTGQHVRTVRPGREQRAVQNLPTDRADLMKLLFNNRAYISKNKNRPEKAIEVERRVQENQKIESELSAK